MAQTKHQIQALLSQANMEPRHRFGQNFMIDQNLVRCVAEVGQALPNDLIIEVGPGTGTLTQELLASGARVLAVEIDRDLAQALRITFADQPRFTLIEGDALEGKHALNPQLLQAIESARHAGQPVKLVANLPYNIASPLIIELLLAGVELLVFTVQKEVAQRLRAQAGDDEYGGLSVMVQLLSDVQVIRNLPPSAFWPAPDVDSSLVRLVRRDQLGQEARPMGRFIARLFSFRRKTLRKALSQADYPADAVLEKTGLDGGRRPEEFSPSNLYKIFQALDLPSNDTPQA